MEGTDYQFNEGDRVRLRGSVDSSFYGGYACVGNEGKITKRRKDPYDLPQVFIEWDTNHWSYNGAPNCWTFEEHFDLVGKNEEMDMADKPDKENDTEDLLAKFSEFLALESKSEPEPTPEPVEENFDLRLKDLLERLRDSEVDPDAEYKEATEAAIRLMNECEGFFIVGVIREQTPKAPGGLLAPIALGYSKSDEVELLTMSSAAEYSARAHQSLAVQVIAELRGQHSE